MSMTVKLMDTKGAEYPAAAAAAVVVAAAVGIGDIGGFVGIGTGVAAGIVENIVVGVVEKPPVAVCMLVAFAAAVFAPEQVAAAAAVAVAAVAVAAGFEHHVFVVADFEHHAFVVFVVFVEGCCQLSLEFFCQQGQHLPKAPKHSCHQARPCCRMLQNDDILAQLLIKTKKREGKKYKVSNTTTTTTKKKQKTQGT